MGLVKRLLGLDTFTYYCIGMGLVAIIGIVGIVFGVNSMVSILVQGVLVVPFLILMLVSAIRDLVVFVKMSLEQ